jgi:uncharacterized membrane protein
MEDIKHYIGSIAVIIEAVGVLTIVVGVVIAFTKYLFPGKDIKPRSFLRLRQDLGKGILLGLEILVAADIISTVVTEPTMDKVLTLAVIVLIRTFLSLSLEVELDGKFPWQKSKTENGKHAL